MLRQLCGDQSHPIVALTTDSSALASRCSINHCRDVLSSTLRCFCDGCCVLVLVVDEVAHLLDGPHFLQACTQQRLLRRKPHPQSGLHVFYDLGCLLCSLRLRHGLGLDLLQQLVECLVAVVAVGERRVTRPTAWRVGMMLGLDWLGLCRSRVGGCGCVEIRLACGCGGSAGWPGLLGVRLAGGCEARSGRLALALQAARTVLSQPLLEHAQSSVAGLSAQLHDGASVLLGVELGLLVVALAREVLRGPTLVAESDGSPDADGPVGGAEAGSLHVGLVQVGGCGVEQLEAGGHLLDGVCAGGLLDVLWRDGGWRHHEADGGRSRVAGAAGPHVQAAEVLRSPLEASESSGVVEVDTHLAT